MNLISGVEADGLGFERGWILFFDVELDLAIRGFVPRGRVMHRPNSDVRAYTEVRPPGIEVRPVGRGGVPLNGTRLNRSESRSRFGALTGGTQRAMSSRHSSETAGRLPHCSVRHLSDRRSRPGRLEMKAELQFFVEQGEWCLESWLVLPRLAPDPPTSRSMKKTRAFTLIELLVVIAIIAVLALLIASVAGPYQKNAQLTHVMNNMRQLGAGLMNYTGSHDGQFPSLGAQPGTGAGPIGWGGGGAEAQDAWYNAIPRAAGGRGVLDYANSKEAFYSKANLLFVPAAKYPDNSNSMAYFGIGMNEKLYPVEESQDAGTTVAVRLASIQMPSRTVVFMEVGLPDENPLPGQSKGAYNGSPLASPANTAARYSQPSGGTSEDKMQSKTNIVFADGHAESLPAADVIQQGGQAHMPQLEQYGGRGKVSWTQDPEAVVR
jgi:prepilin-type N-terminal cleavage/methylation domain-containing protein/prepilin-type processing-associated H-X9-DG protein